jgi:hypothetical protein
MESLRRARDDIKLWKYSAGSFLFALKCTFPAGGYLIALVQWEGCVDFLCTKCRIIIVRVLVTREKHVFVVFVWKFC